MDKVRGLPYQKSKLNTNLIQNRLSGILNRSLFHLLFRTSNFQFLLPAPDRDKLYLNEWIKMAFFFFVYPRLNWKRTSKLIWIVFWWSLNNWVIDFCRKSSCIEMLFWDFVINSVVILNKNAHTHTHFLKIKLHLPLEQWVSS